MMLGGQNIFFLSFTYLCLYLPSCGYFWWRQFWIIKKYYMFLTGERYFSSKGGPLFPNESPFPSSQKTLFWELPGCAGSPCKPLVQRLGSKAGLGKERFHLFACSSKITKMTGSTYAFLGTPHLLWLPVTCIDAVVLIFMNPEAGPYPCVFRKVPGLFRESVQQEQSHWAPSPCPCPSVLPSAHGQCGQKGAGAGCAGASQVSGAAGGGHPRAPQEILACELLLYLLVLGLALCWRRWPGALVSRALNIGALKVKPLDPAWCSAGSQVVMILRREPEAFGTTWCRLPETQTTRNTDCDLKFNPL